MQVVEIDGVGSEALKTLLDLRAKRVWATAAAVAALGGDHEPVGRRRERLTDRALAVAARVHVCGIDQADARFDCLAQEDVVLRRRGEPVGSKTDPCDLGTGEGQLLGYR
jgi:hypothetical protein